MPDRLQRFLDFDSARVIGLAGGAFVASLANHVDLILKIGQIALIIVSVGYTAHRWRRSVIESRRAIKSADASE